MLITKAWENVPSSLELLICAAIVAFYGGTHQAKELEEYTFSFVIDQCCDFQFKKIRELLKQSITSVTQIYRLIKIMMDWMS